jgi:amino acid transporter
VVVAFFLSEAIFNVFLAIIPSFSANNVHVGFVCILAIVLYASNVILSIFKHKFCVSVAKCLAYIKFIPIITIFLVGVIFAIVNGNIGLFNSSNNGGINFNGMISSITPALFAFDGFLFVAAISSSIKKPEKTIPKSLLISIIIIGSCYIAITFSLLLIGDGNMTNFFEKVCGDNQVLKNVISCIFAFVIVIALVATVNGFIMGAIFALQCSREENFLAFGANCHVVNNNEEYSKKKHNLIYMLFFLVF